MGMRFENYSCTFIADYMLTDYGHRLVMALSFTIMEIAVCRSIAMTM